MCDRRRSALLLPQDAIKRVGDAIGESRNSDLSILARAAPEGAVSGLA